MQESMYHLDVPEKIKILADEQRKLLVELTLLDSPDCNEGRNIANKIIDTSKQISHFVYRADQYFLEENY